MDSDSPQELIRENARLRKELSEARESEKILKGRLRLMLFGRDHTLDEVLVETLNILEDLTGSQIGFYHFVQEDQKTLSLHAWSTRTSERFCKASGKGTHYDIDKAGVWVDCVRLGKPVIHNDYQSLEYKKGMPEGHAKVVRELVVPVFRSGKIVAVLGVGNKESYYDEVDLKIVTRLADMAWDIAERMIFLERIRASEAKFRAIADYSRDWELWIDPAGKLIWTNNAAEELTGYTPSEIMEMEDFPNCLIRVPDREKMGRHMEEAARGYKATNIEFRLITKDGREKWCGIAYQTIFDDQGNSMGFRASIRDITGQKRTEQELDRLTEKLVEMLAHRNMNQSNSD